MLGRSLAVAVPHPVAAVAFTHACALAQGQSAMIYINSCHVFDVIHDFGQTAYLYWSPVMNSCYMEAFLQPCLLSSSSDVVKMSGPCYPL